MTYLVPVEDTQSLQVVDGGPGVQEHLAPRAQADRV